MPALSRLARDRRLRLDFAAFVREPHSRERFTLRWEDRLDRSEDATTTMWFDRHYTLHLAWAARVLSEVPPKRHTDISSLVYFAVQMSAFFPVDFYDYRPAAIELDGLTSERADLVSLPFESASIESLSCMHVVEHVGLGRYGDRLDPQGDLSAMTELRRVLAPGGRLLFVVPVGRPKIVFNAHRIYSYELIVEAFQGLNLVEFALIPDRRVDGDLVRHADPALVKQQDYACGCFLFEAPAGGANHA